MKSISLKRLLIAIAFLSSSAIFSQPPPGPGGPPQLPLDNWAFILGTISIFFAIIKINNFIKKTT